MSEHQLWRGRWLWYALGIGMIAYGARGLHDHTSTKALIHTGRLMVLDVIGHDGLFAPVAFVTAFLTQRILPPVARTPIRVGLAVSVVLVLLAYPVIQSPRRQYSPSILPLPYGRNLTLLLAAVLLGVVLSIAWNLATQGRGRKASDPVSEADSGRVAE